MLGISLGDCQVGSRRQGVKQQKRGKEEKRGKQEVKQEENWEENDQEKNPIEWGKIKVEMENGQRKESFTCSECGKQYTRKDHLKRHKIQHTTDNGLLSCNQCYEIVESTYKLNEHVMREHGVTSNFDNDTHALERSYACVNCPETFKSSKQRYKHNSSHHSGVTIPCDECEKQFSRKDKLYTHKKNKHSM